MDGSLLSSGLAGAGVVSRGEDGDPILAAGLVLMHWDLGGVELAAVLALRSWISPAMFGARGVIMEGDCQVVMDSFLADLHCDDWCATTYGQENLSFLDVFPKVRFHHVGRERTVLRIFVHVRPCRAPF